MYISPRTGRMAVSVEDIRSTERFLVYVRAVNGYCGNDELAKSAESAANAVAEFRDALRAYRESCNKKDGGK